MKIVDFNDLRVFQAAFESAMRLFELSKAWPKEEKYSLVDQIRRSSRSVAANIAEAWRKRRYPAAFVSKLSDADAEAAETLVWLKFALRCGYLKQPAFESLTEEFRHMNAQLATMMQNPGQWCSHHC